VSRLAQAGVNGTADYTTAMRIKAMWLMAKTKRDYLEQNDLKGLNQGRREGGENAYGIIVIDGKSWGNRLWALPGKAVQSCGLRPAAKGGLMGKKNSTSWR
jgi:hypothetical protein